MMKGCGADFSAGKIITLQPLVLLQQISGRGHARASQVDIKKIPSERFPRNQDRTRQMEEDRRVALSVGLNGWPATTFVKCHWTATHLLTSQFS